MGYSDGYYKASNKGYSGVYSKDSMLQVEGLP